LAVISVAETSAGYQTFVDNLNKVLGENFSAQVPTVTKRSKGLDPQCGLVLGLRPNNQTTARLVASLGQLPEVWSRYDQTTLHLTLAACEDRTTSNTTVPLADGRSMEERYKLLLEAETVARGGACLGNLRVLFSGDTIVLTGVPSLGLYVVRGLLTDTEAAQTAGVRPGWGAHFTLARATRTLTDDERDATNKWAHDLCLPASADLIRVVTGAFSVSGDHFRFTNSSLCQLEK
jgi:hypothetical protein